jgi:ectoine hydroxylase-related dioxygenase (phytanoyl-CoA dioxygenase family)
MKLTAQQLHSYADDGFLVLPDVVDRKTVERARKALMTRIADGQANPLHAYVNDSAVVACFGRDVCAAAAELAGVRKRFAPPRVTYTVSVFPTTQEWKWPPPHIDHAHEKDGFQTFPAPFRIACMIYLTDVQQHGGSTVVWPGSHRRLEALAMTDPQRYKYLATLYRDISKLDLGCPKEIVANAGDALFYHYLCAHSGSNNTRTQPRLALNHKW